MKAVVISISRSKKTARTKKIIELLKQAGHEVEERFFEDEPFVGGQQFTWCIYDECSPISAEACKKLKK